MKPTDEKYQAATRVNAVSSEIRVFEEADSLQALEGNMVMLVTGENMTTLPGSKAVA